MLEHRERRKICKYVSVTIPWRVWVLCLQFISSFRSKH